MSTRATISFHTEEVSKHNIITQDPIATLYSHYDGYEEGVIPFLLPAVQKFDNERGISDMHYGAVRVIQNYIENRGHTNDALGYGLHPANQRFNLGIEYHYTIDPKTIKVWEMKWTDDDKTPEYPVLIATHNIKEDVK